MSVAPSQTEMLMLMKLTETKNVNKDSRIGENFKAWKAEKMALSPYNLRAGQFVRALT